MYTQDAVAFLLFRADRAVWARALAGLGASFTFTFLHGKDRSSSHGVIYVNSPGLSRSLPYTKRIMQSEDLSECPYFEQHFSGSEK